MSTVIVVGAGMAGLSAAAAAASEGAHVVLYETAGHAGGRCRSYYDATLDCLIDNGNHLVLSGNSAVRRYLHAIGAGNALAGPDHAEFRFADLGSGERWTIAPNDGPLPWWIFAGDRRVPGTAPLDYAKFAGLLTAGPMARIGDLVSCSGPLWERLMRPLLLAVLNTEPERASATLAAAVLRETLAKGGKAYRPRIATPNLGAAFVDPALAFLAGKGAMVHYGQRLRRIVFDDKNVAALEFPENAVVVSPGDKVVLAVPPWVAGQVVPGLGVPDEFRSIVNAHFKIAPPPGAPAMLGVIGGAAEWIFAFPDRVSVTVSAADAIVDLDREELAKMLWADVAKALRIEAMLPTWQIVKEKRATIAATPEQNGLRPAAKTQWKNLMLAGDWTDTGLPATIEGALRSGFKAAQL
jgi:hydroxysqualene dehydroxylase